MGSVRFVSVPPGEKEGLPQLFELNPSVYVGARHCISLMRPFDSIIILQKGFMAQQGHDVFKESIVDMVNAQACKNAHPGLTVKVIGREDICFLGNPSLF